MITWNKSKIEVRTRFHDQKYQWGSQILVFDLIRIDNNGSAPEFKVEIDPAQIELNATGKTPETIAFARLEIVDGIVGGIISQAQKESISVN